MPRMHVAEDNTNESDGTASLLKVTDRYVQ